MFKLLRNTSLYTIGNILPKVASFFLLPLYTRYLTPEDYGIVNSMNVLMTILTVFFTMAIDRAIYRLYYDYKTEKGKKDFLGSVFITLILNAFIMLIITLLGKNILGKVFSSIPFYPYYVYIIGTVFFTTFGIIPKTYFQVQQKAGTFIIISLAEFVISTGLIIYFIVFAGKGASGMLLAGLIKSLILLPLFLFVIYKITNFTFKPKIMKESLSYSMPLVPALLSAWILNLSDRIFIERYFSLKDVGLYGLSYRMAEILMVFIAGFYKAYNPIFYQIANQENQIEAKEKLFKYNKIYLIILIYFALGISLFSKEFILLLDAKYISAYKLVPLIMIGILFSQAGGLLNLTIYQQKKTKQIMFLILTAGFLNIGLNWLLVPRYGSTGAALATTITFISFYIIKYFYSKKCYFIPVAKRELGFYLVFFLLTITIFSFINFNLWISILLKTSVMTIFTFILFIKYKEIIFRLLPIKRKR